MDAGTLPSTWRRSQLLMQTAEGTWQGFDVTRDGQRFLVTRVLSGPTTRPLHVILNWQQLSERR